MAEKILTKNFDLRDSHTLRVYREAGGYRAWDKARATLPVTLPGKRLLNARWSSSNT